MKNQFNNIAILATYWNEKTWIKPSLNQIELLKPKLVIICDGCFDARYENGSTDGTFEEIKKWAQNKPYVNIVRATRVTRFEAMSYYLRRMTLSSFFLSLDMLRKSIYRINQGITFDKMLSLVKNDVEWVMTFDADQFYSDEMIANIIEVINSETDLELLVGHEKTFFSDFSKYTTDYDLRTYNNMPHRVLPGMFVKPTRGLVVDRFWKYVFYKDFAKQKDVGTYCHYKFRPNDAKRDHMTYQVGDRKAPDKNKFKMKKFLGKHPKSIRKFFRV